MIGAQTKVTRHTGRVDNAVKKASFRNFGHAAASIRKDAAASLQRVASDDPSPPGQPPHTHKGVFLKRALRYHVDPFSAVIGPRESVVGKAASAHEHGGRYKGAEYPQRPFMFPALQRAIPRIGNRWRGSIGR